MNPRAPSPDLIATVRRMRAAGGTYTSIAAALERSKGQIAGLVRRHVDGKPDAFRPYATRKRGPYRPRVKPAKPVLGFCCWPLSSGRPWAFCERAVTTPGNYCDAHRKKAYVKRRELPVRQAGPTQTMGGAWR